MTIAINGLFDKKRELKLLRINNSGITIEIALKPGNICIYILYIIYHLYQVFQVLWSMLSIGKCLE